MKANVFPRIGATLMLCGAVAVAQPVFAAQENNTPTLTVSASASVEGDPDLAVVRLGAVAEARDAAGAQHHINTIMNQVFRDVTALGVADKNIRTESLSLRPVYSRPSSSDDDAGDRSPHITGYRASNVISIRLHNLDGIGAVIDAGIQAGANKLQGVSFQLKNGADARAEALGAAVHKARRQADAVADALAMQVGGVNSVAVGHAAPPRPVRFSAARVLADAATSVHPGQVEVSASVTITYELRRKP